MHTLGLSLCLTQVSSCVSTTFFVATFKNGNLLNQHPLILTYSKNILLQKKYCCWFREKEHHTHGWYYRICTTTITLTQVSSGVSTPFLVAKFKNRNLLNQHLLIPTYSKKTFHYRKNAAADSGKGNIIHMAGTVKVVQQLLLWHRY